jgi:hypothetical protein
VVIRDASGIHRYLYFNGEGNYPITLNKGENTVSLWVKVAHKDLPGSENILSASDFNFGGHCVVVHDLGAEANPQGNYCAIPTSASASPTSTTG